MHVLRASQASTVRRRTPRPGARGESTGARDPTRTWARVQARRSHGSARSSKYRRQGRSGHGERALGALRAQSRVDSVRDSFAGGCGEEALRVFDQRLPTSAGVERIRFIFVDEHQIEIRVDREFIAAQLAQGDDRPRCARGVSWRRSVPSPSPRHAVVCKQRELLVQRVERTVRQPCDQNLEFLAALETPKMVHALGSGEPFHPRQARVKGPPQCLDRWSWEGKRIEQLGALNEALGQQFSVVQYVDEHFGQHGVLEETSGEQRCASGFGSQLLEAHQDDLGPRTPDDPVHGCRQVVGEHISRRCRRACQ